MRQGVQFRLKAIPRAAVSVGSVALLPFSPFLGVESEGWVEFCWAAGRADLAPFFAAPLCTGLFWDFDAAAPAPPAP